MTRSDLSALTGVPPYKLDSVLRGVRPQPADPRVWVSRDADSEPVTRVYLFAHETLRATAGEQLGGELTRYRRGIHDWISCYASQRWPDTTPDYAIRGYARLLTATGDVTRLSVLARDPDRHAFLLRVTGSDYAALAEIRTAQGLIGGQNIADLQVLASWRSTDMRFLSAISPSR